MLDRLDSVPDSLHVRAALAYSVRIAWRVLPLLREEAAGRYVQAGLAMAEAVAGGEAVHPLQSRVTLQRLEMAGRTFSKQDPRLRCALDTACYAVLGGLHTHRAMEEIGIDLMAAAKAQDNDLQVARKALYTAMNEGMRALGLRATPWTVEDADRRLASRALSGDLDRLVHHRAPDSLGHPVWPAERGQLGELWRSGETPSWHRDKDPDDTARSPAAIVPGVALSTSDSVTAVPTIVFWTLYEGDLDAEQIHRQVLAISDRHEQRSAPKPVYVVHAPLIASDWVRRFMEVGATVLRDIPAEHWHDGQGSGLEAWLASTLRIQSLAAERGTASWRREEAHMNWRDPGYLATSGRPRGIDRTAGDVAGVLEVSPSATARRTASSPYAAFVARSMQSMEDRIGAERGRSEER